MPRNAWIEKKIAQIEDDIEVIGKKHEEYRGRIGGAAVPISEEIAFQQRRLDLLRWARAATREEVKRKIRALSIPVSQYSLINMRDHPDRIAKEDWEPTCHMELMEDALRFHRDS